MSCLNLSHNLSLASLWEQHSANLRNFSSRHCHHSHNSIDRSTATRQQNDNTQSTRSQSKVLRVVLCCRLNIVEYLYSPRKIRWQQNNKKITHGKLNKICFNLPDALTLGGAYDGGRASPVGL